LTDGAPGDMLAPVMPVSAILLVIVSGFILSVWNLFVKKAAKPSAFFLGAILFALALYTPVFFLLIAPGIGPPSFEAFAAALSAGLTEGLYFVLLTYTYRRGDLSLVYPVSRGSAPLFIVAGGILFLTERVTAVGGLGIALIVLGIAAVAWPGRGARVTFVAVALSILTGASIAAHHICYKWALRFWSPYAAIYLAWSVAAFALAFYCVVTRPFFEVVRYIYDHALAAAGVGVLAMAGFICALAALDMTLVSYVGAARNVGMVFSVLFGARLLGEGAMRRRLAGAAAITFGVAVMAFA
jgi:drug/metabolite transporter (DMT)-like permease